MATLPEILARLRVPLEDLARDEAQLASARGMDRTVATFVAEGLGVERDFARKEFLRELKILFLTFDEDSLSERKRKLARALDIVAALEKSTGGPVPVPEPVRPEVTPPLGTPLPPLAEEASDLPAPWSGDPRFAQAA